MKEDYYRRLFFSNSNIDKILSAIPGWDYEEKVIGGTRYKVLENKERNVMVGFLDISGYWHSTNVQPINPTGDIYNVYEDGFDASEQQKEDIREDILYYLWLLINKTSDDKMLGIHCGLVPSRKDYKDV